MMEQSVSLLGKSEPRSKFQPLLLVCCVMLGFFIRDLVPNKQFQTGDIKEATVAAVSTVDTDMDEEVRVGNSACCKCKDTGEEVFWSNDGVCTDDCESKGGTAYSILGASVEDCKKIPAANWHLEVFAEPKIVTCCECKPKTQPHNSFMVISLDHQCSDCQNPPTRQIEQGVKECKSIEDCTNLCKVEFQKQDTSGTPIKTDGKGSKKSEEAKSLRPGGKLTTKELDDVHMIDACFTMSHCCMDPFLSQRCDYYWVSKSWHVYNDVVGQTTEGGHTDQIKNWVDANIQTQFCEAQERFYTRSVFDYALVAINYLVIMPVTKFGTVIKEAAKKGLEAEIGPAADTIFKVVDVLIFAFGAALKEFFVSLEKVAIWEKLKKIPITNTGGSYKVKGAEEYHAKGHDLASFVLNVDKFHSPDIKFPIWCRVAYSWRLAFLPSLTNPVGGVVSAIIQWRDQIESIAPTFIAFKDFLGRIKDKLTFLKLPNWAQTKLAAVMPEFGGMIDSVIQDPAIAEAIKAITEKEIAQIQNDGRGMVDTFMNALTDYIFGSITRSLLVKCKEKVETGSKPGFLARIKALFSSSEDQQIIQDSKIETEVRVGSAANNDDQHDAEFDHEYDEEEIAADRPDLRWRGAVHYANVRNELHKTNWQHPGLEELAADAHNYFQKYGDKHYEADPENFYAANPHFLD